MLTTFLIYDILYNVDNNSQQKIEAMKLSTRARYGTRILLDLALHCEGPVPLKDIAQRQQISLAYLEHLITPLIAGGIVRSVRGPKGGVSLVKAPEEVKVSEIIRLLEGPIALVECIDNPGVCMRSQLCVTRDVWSELKKAMDGVLESTTLQDLVKRYKKKEQPEPEMYYV